MNLRLLKHYTLLFITVLSISSSGFAKDEPVDKVDMPTLSVSKRKLPVPVSPARKGQNSRFDNDPIRFTLRANKQTVAPGEEMELTITAHYLDILSSQLFILPGSNAFAIKVLTPDGFIQTGGDYADYIGTQLSPTNPSVTYTLKGYFTKAGQASAFRLLRGQANANAASLFVEKARLSIKTNSYKAAARVASDNIVLTANCEGSNLSISGSLTTSNSNRISILVFKDNAIVNAINDLVGPSFS
ncbi:hypothetical protein [Spirosoma endbachense]|uniref:Auto-transporter adhesin head GIN domain-containing protein n=1 Tax=Spirosoma endbachense TaxID=2666025 RepID=A0A6P1VWF0_9BACT|nr:hypothetical protein [Spirosoma endbachense]QHV97541.1 hypothetical protein GJR95_22155 [Spirosoma endbachense]